MSTAFPSVYRLPADAASVREARQTVIGLVGDILPEGDRDRALLATSEIVTNAVEHGSPPIELRVDRYDARVRIEVRDASPLRPRLRDDDPGPEEIRGRGMLIVERCTDRWGMEELADGKAVWFELDT